MKTPIPTWFGDSLAVKITNDELLILHDVLVSFTDDGAIADVDVIERAKAVRKRFVGFVRAINRGKRVSESGKWILRPTDVDAIAKALAAVAWEHAAEVERRVTRWLCGDPAEPVA